MSNIVDIDTIRGCNAEIFAYIEKNGELDSMYLAKLKTSISMGHLILDTVMDQPFDNEDELNELLRKKYMLSIFDHFYVWLVNNGETPKLDTWKRFLRVDGVSTTNYFNPHATRGFNASIIKSGIFTRTAKMKENALKVLKEIFPDRIEHFYEKDEYIEGEDKEAKQKELEQFTRGVERSKRDKELNERNLRLLTNDFLELMYMLPDNQSRKHAKEYINSLLSAKDLQYKFNGGGSMHGGVVDVIGQVEELLRYIKDDTEYTRDRPTTLTSTALSILNGSKLDDNLQKLKKELSQNKSTADSQMTQNLQSVLLSLLYGTGLEEKINKLDKDSTDESSKSKVMMELLVDGVKTGLLATLATTSGATEKIEENLKSAESRQDAIAQTAVLATIATLMDQEKQATASSNLQSSVEAVKSKLDSNEELQLQVAQTALLNQIAASNYFTKSEADALKARVDALQSQIGDNVTKSSDILSRVEEAIKAENLDARIVPKVAAKLAETVNPIREETVQSLLAQTLNSLGLLDLMDKNGKPKSDETIKADIVRTISQELAENQKAFERTFTERFDNYVSELEKLRTLVNALDLRVQGHDQILAANETVMDELRENLSLKASNEHVTKIDTRVKKLESNDDYSKLDGTFKDLTNLLNSRAKEIAAEPKAGGSGDAAKDPVAQAKQFRKELDDVKKNLRNITDALGGLKTKYDKFKKMVKQVVPDHGVKKPEAPKGLAEPDDAAEAAKADLKPEAPMVEPPKLEEKQVLGLYSYFSDEGKAFVSEAKETIADKKKLLVESQTAVQKILDTEPMNQQYLKMGLEMKKHIEGDYDKEADLGAGFLSKLDSVYGQIKAEYDEAYGAVKAQAEGIKQQKEYEIRGKQNNVLNPYAMPMGQQRGGADINLEELTKGINDNILKNIVQKLDQVYARKLNPALASAVIGEPTLFMTLYNDYINNKEDANVGQVLAAQKLTEQMEANHLIPADVMKVNNLDKTIFVFVTLVIRKIALAFASHLIMKGKLRTLPWALGVFLFIYALIYVGFVLFINLDMYRLRILFNYLNLHGNSANIFLHIGLMWMFSFVIFLLIWNLNFPLRGVKTTAITDEEKANLIYRLEVLTMIVWLFLVLMIVIT